MSLFVAVDVPVAVRRQVRAALPPVQAVAPHLRLTADASWHVTLVFLGRAEADVHPFLHAALAPVSARWRSFEVCLDGRAGTFGRRVLWAGFAPSPPLGELAADVRAATARALAEAAGAARACSAPPAGEPFTAHLTLARAPRRGRGVPRAAVEAYQGPEVCWRVDALQLLSSAGRPHGGRYTVEGQWRLGG